MIAWVRSINRAGRAASAISSWGSIACRRIDAAFCARGVAPLVLSRARSSRRTVSISGRGSEESILSSLKHIQLPQVSSADMEKRVKGQLAGPADALVPEPHVGAL